MRSATTEVTHSESKDTNPLFADFPVVMEQGKPKAVLIDIAVLRQLQVIVDNLLNREAEPEDAVLATSEAFHRLLAKVEAETPTPSKDWRMELRAL